MLCFFRTLLYYRVTRIWTPLLASQRIVIFWELSSLLSKIICWLTLWLKIVKDVWVSTFHNCCCSLTTGRMYAFTRYGNPRNLRAAYGLIRGFEFLDFLRIPDSSSIFKVFFYKKKGDETYVVICTI